jgi:alkaline phosphatase D
LRAARNSRHPGATKLGARQEEWLAWRLAASKSRWNLITQGTVMAYVDEQPGPGEKFWTDGWSGYPAARDRLLAAVESTRVSNPLVLSGDIHAFAAANLNRVRRRIRRPRSSRASSRRRRSARRGCRRPQLDQRRIDSPAVLMLNGESRGYLRLDITPDRLQADMIALDTVARRDSTSRVAATFVIENGKPGPVRA